MPVIMEFSALHALEEPAPPMNSSSICLEG